MRVRARDPEHRAVEGGAGRRVREAAQLAQVAFEQVEVEPPLPAAVRTQLVPDQALQQEAAHHPARDGGLQRGVGVGPAVQRVEVHGLHGGDERGEGGRLLVLVVGPAALERVLDGRDVDDDQRAQQLGPSQRQRHRHLAAHRVPDQGHRFAVPGQLGGDQVGHVLVVDAVGPGGVAVVGQVEQRHPVPVGEPLGDRGPVPALTEQPVQEHHARPGLAQGAAVQPEVVVAHPASSPGPGSSGRPGRAVSAAAPPWRRSRRSSGWSRPRSRSAVHRAPRTRR